MRISWNRFLWAGCIALILPLTLPLTGCPSRHAASQAAPPPQATAPAVAAPQPQQQPAAPTPKPNTAEQQRVRQVIAQAEAAYTRGQADYSKGQLAEAKIQFDQAVDLMLSCGIDIRSNAQLGDAFDKIVDQVNALEMDALKQGNGFVPKEELTPAEAASDVTFAVDPNLVAKARADLATTKSDLPLMVNEYVASFINFFAYTQKGHNTLLHSFERAGLYKGMIQRVLAEEGVPQDLIYLAVAESGFQPHAVNRTSRAGGIWQFMPYGDYGLTRNEYVDERFDPEKSTRAYARYMKFLYNQLGDWYLAMAAYDWGAGNVQRAVEKTGYADFWELYKRHNLPGETQNYVPEILAAIIIANNPHQYGFDDVTLDPPVLTDTVTVDYSVDLRLVSDLVGAPVDEIEALNPSLLRGVTPPDQSFDLRLPAGTSTLFDQRIAQIPEDKRNSWRYHPVVADDTLDSVAREYRVSVADLAEANQLSPRASADESLSGLQGLVVPVPLEAARSAHARLYTVRRGDTLVTIADRFGVSLAQLRRWNGIPSGTRVAAGRRLHIAEPVAHARTISSRHRSSGTGKTASTSRTAGRASSKLSTAARSRSSRRADPIPSKDHKKSSSRTAHSSAKSSAQHARAAAK